MDLSIFLAKIYGAVFVAIGLAFLFNANYYKKMLLEILKNSAFMFMWGAMGFVIGLAIIINHNIWEASWIVIITIIGWLALLKGALLLLLPRVVIMFESWFKYKGMLIFAGVFALIFGGALCYFGWLV